MLSQSAYNRTLCPVVSSAAASRSGRKNAQQPESLARRSATQRRHRQAIQNWKTSDLPCETSSASALKRSKTHRISKRTDSRTDTRPVTDVKGIWDSFLFADNTPRTSFFAATTLDKAKGSRICSFSVYVLGASMPHEPATSRQADPKPRGDCPGGNTDEPSISVETCAACGGT